MTRSQLHAAQDKRLLEFMGIATPYQRPRSEWKESDPKKILSLADPHNPYISLKVCKAAEKETDAETVIVAGDVGDYYSKSRFRKTRPVSFDSEVRSVFLYLEWLATNWKSVKIMLGNHDCLDAETMCLTRELGWAKYGDLRAGMHALTMSDSGSGEWQAIDDVIVGPHDGPVYCTETENVSMCVTGNHRLFLIPGKDARGGRHYVDASGGFSDKRKSRSWVPVSADNKRPDWDGATDTELAIVGWILTDGGIQKRARGSAAYSIYQRESKAGLVESLLVAAGYQYTRMVRQRDIMEVAGKRLKKAPEREVQFLILAASLFRLRILMGDTKEIPEWIYWISKRQFDILLSAMIDGDGSRKKNNPNSQMLYVKGVARCARIQAALVMNGYRTSLYPYPNDNYRINIHQYPAACLERGYSHATTTRHYRGDTWCVRVPNSNFMVMRNGRAYFTGNSRPEKQIQDIMGKDVELMILTEQNLLLNLASFFDNIEVVGAQIEGDAVADGRRHKVNLTHIYQHGDLIFTHGEKSMAQASSLMMGISQYLHRWKTVLGLKPYRIIAQAHNHADLRMTMGDERWMQLPAACEPVSIGMEYIFNTRMIGNPPVTGYSVFYQDAGETDYNTSRSVVL